MGKYIVAALYQFTPLPDFKELQEILKDVCSQNQILGTLLLAEEGINGTVAGTREGIDALKEVLDARFDALEYKESWAEEMPFRRLKVRLKKEIVTLGVEGVDPLHEVGTYVEPKKWNELISDPDVILIDTRNDYEFDIGTFQNAVNPKTKTFHEFPDFAKNLPKDKPVAMFCTGGIRCEKATSYLLSQGFKDVYHLKGGILKYLEEVAPEESLWEGDCFVFDGRVALGHGLTQGHHQTCYGCRRPISVEDMQSEEYERGVSCPHCFKEMTPEKREAARQRQQQEDLALHRGQKHIGAVM